MKLVLAFLIISLFSLLSLSTIKLSILLSSSNISSVNKSYAISFITNILIKLSTTSTKLLQPFLNLIFIILE